MPKKTKQEKIIAELRRKLEEQKISHPNLEAKPRPQTIASPEEKSGRYRLPPMPIKKEVNPSLVAKAQLTSEEPQSSSASYIGADLKKTFLLSGLAISFEVIVYWVTNLGGGKIIENLVRR
jgi:hypothetical protein